MALTSYLCLMFLVQIFTTITYKCSGQNLPKFSAILIFGDSGVDPGNNNYLNTIAKGNYPPYGMHFPGQVPTGRFSDGKLVTDFVASKLGIKELVPPFLQSNLSDQELLTGVSFASAASGWDDQTCALSNAIPMSKQPQYLKDYVTRITRIVGRQEAQRIVNEALVTITAGAVDFLYNFDLGRTNRRIEFSAGEYTDFLQNKLKSFLKQLYSLGGRNMIVSGLPPLGCLPLVMTENSPISRTCIEHMNLEAESYNQKLANLLQQTQAELPGSKILYVDTYSPLMDMINNPKKYGFAETKRGCCGTGVVEMGVLLCIPLTPVCGNSSQYIFWDSVHPTEATFRYLSDHFEKEVLSMLARNDEP